MPGLTLPFSARGYGVGYGGYGPSASAPVDLPTPIVPAMVSTTAAPAAASVAPTVGSSAAIPAAPSANPVVPTVPPAVPTVSPAVPTVTPAVPTVASTVPTVAPAATSAAQPTVAAPAGSGVRRRRGTEVKKAPAASGACLRCVSFSPVDF